MRAKVFYDGACPMCSREIAHYRRSRGADALDWVDIHSQPEELDRHGLDRDTALARFHVLGEDGVWHTGVAGFVYIWRRLRGYRHLAKVFDKTGATRLLEPAYVRFARWRQRKAGKSCSRCVGPQGH